MGDRPISNIPLQNLPPHARYDDGFTALSAGGPKRQGLGNWADLSQEPEEAAHDDTEWEEEGEEEPSPTVPNDANGEAPPEFTYNPRPTYFDEIPGPRPLSKAELLREVGEAFPIDTCLFAKDNGLPDPPPGLKGNCYY